MNLESGEICKTNCHASGATGKHRNPDHAAHSKKLNRIIGQLQGVQRMIEERRYCPDILTQTRAAASALKSVELLILRSHMESCVRDALTSRRQQAAAEKLQEVVSLLQRF